MQIFEIGSEKRRQSLNRRLIELGPEKNNQKQCQYVALEKIPRPDQILKKKLELLVEQEQEGRNLSLERLPNQPLG